MDYLAEAKRTLPDQRNFHGQIIPLDYIMSSLHRAVETGNVLDTIKKGLFYGKDADGNFADLTAKALGKWNGTYLIANRPEGVSEEDMIDLIHAVLGQFTESVELVEMLLKVIVDKTMPDRTNIIEEVGDGFWYVAILMRNYGFTFSDSQVANIDKLYKRFPDKFDENFAINRDHAAERIVLDGHAAGQGAALHGFGLGSELLTPARLEKALEYALNVESIDAKAGYSDWELAALLVPQIAKHLRGETDAQVLEACPDEGCPHYGTPHSHAHKPTALALDDSAYVDGLEREVSAMDKARALGRTVWSLEWGGGDVPNQTRYFDTSRETDAIVRMSQRVVELDGNDKISAAWVHLKRMPDSVFPDGQLLAAWTKTSDERPTDEGAMSIDDL